MAQPLQYLPGYYTGSPPPNSLAVNAAEPAAGVTAPPGRAISRVPQDGLQDMAWGVGEFGTSFLAQTASKAGWATIGKVAAPLALGVSAYNAGRAADKDEKEMIAQFAPEIAREYNVSEQAVNENMLQEAAKHSAILNERREAMEQQKIAKPLATGAEIAVGIGATILTGGVGVVPSLIGLAASAAASYGMDALMKHAGVIPPDYTAKADLDALIEDREQGKEVTGAQIFKLFAKADKKLGALVEERAGGAADKVPIETLLNVMHDYHPMMNANCAALAGMINQDQLRPQALAFILPEQLTVGHPEVMEKLKAQAANGNTPQPVISTAGLAYSGQGIGTAANQNIAPIGQFTARLAAEQGVPQASPPQLG